MGKIRRKIVNDHLPIRLLILTIENDLRPTQIFQTRTFKFPFIFEVV